MNMKLVLSVPAVSILLTAAGPLLAQNLVTNGDFSSNAASFTTFPGYVGGSNPADIDNWTKMPAATTQVGINGSGISNPFGPSDKSAATYYAFLQSNAPELSQAIIMSPSTGYNLSFVAGNRASNPNAEGRVVIQDNSSVYYDSGVTNWGTGAFQLVNASFVTPASIDGTVTITLNNDSPAGDNTVCYGNVSLTENIAPPGIDSLSPADDAPSASTGGDLIITFDEFVVKGSGDIVIKRSADDSVVEAIDVTSPQVTVDGLVVTINPTDDFDRGVGYYVEVPSTAFDDLTGNDFPGISGNAAWNFITTIVNFIPISGDADSGISSAKTYTHAIDFGNDTPAALVNGVQFQSGMPAFGPIGGTSATIGTGTLNLPSSHPGNANAEPYLVDGGMEDLVEDMVYNAPNGVITLTGLTPGVEYEIRFYNRAWAVGDRGQEIGFDTDGVGSDITGAEARAAFKADDASAPDPSFATATQVNALTYTYTLAPGVDTLTIYINKTATGTYHLYGLTNEVAAGPSALTFSPANGGVDASLTGTLAVTFDELVELGVGNITIRRSADDSAVEVIDVTSGQVTIDRNTATIDPSVILDDNTNYYVEIDAGAFVDFSGNPFAGISGGATWSFDTTVVTYVAITGDADSGISAAKTYTHAIDFGNNGTRPTATVNGVVFVNGGPGAFPSIGGSSQTLGTGSSTIPASNNGNDAAAPFLADQGMKDLVGDMIFNNLTAEVLLTGLTPGAEYNFRLYNRRWGGSERGQVIGFDTDGVGSDISGAEATSIFKEDDATAPDPGFATADQVNALSYTYSLAPGVTTLTVYINATGAGSYHLYGLTNEEVTAGTPYNSWGAANGLSGGEFAFDADSEADGLVQLLEFGFGTDPNVGDNAPLVADGTVNGTPVVQLAGGAGGVTFDLLFVRRDDHGTPGSVNYTVQFSGDLVQFHDSTVTPAFVVDSTDDPAYEVVSVPYPALLPDGKKASYARVRVDVVP